VKGTKWYKQLLGRSVAATLLLLLTRPVPAAGGQDKTAAAPNDQTKPEYVGVDVCKTCHEDLYKKNFEPQRISRPPCKTATAASPVTVRDPSTWQAEETLARSSGSASYQSRRPRTAA